MSYDSGPKFVLPTLQANLNYAIGEVLQRLNTDGPYEVWVAIDTLCGILPPTVYENPEVSKDYKMINDYLNNGHDGSTTNYMDQRRRSQRILGFLHQHNRPYFRLVYKKLYEGQYLEKNMGIRTHETGVHKIGERLHQ